MADISRQPEFMRLGEIDMTLREFMPMTSGDGSQYQDEYLDMESLVAGGYEHRQPHDDYLAMAPQTQHQPHDDYLSMGAAANVPDQYSNLTFSDS